MMIHAFYSCITTSGTKTDFLHGLKTPEEKFEDIKGHKSKDRQYKDQTRDVKTNSGRENTTQKPN